MKANQATTVSCAVLFAAALAFYMLVLSPKRSEVSQLNDEVSSLETQVAEQEQLVSFGREARKEFPRDYGRLVVLGKAVPDQADTASLLVELNSIAGASGVEFRGITLSAGSGEATTPAATTPPPAAEGATAPGSTTATTATTATTPRAAAATGRYAGGSRAARPAGRRQRARARSRRAG